MRFDISRRGARARSVGLVQSKYSRRRSRWHRHWMQKGWREEKERGCRLARGKAGGVVKPPSPPLSSTDRHTTMRHSTSTLDQPTNQLPDALLLPPPHTTTGVVAPRCPPPPPTLGINENDVTAKSPAFNYQSYASRSARPAHARAPPHACPCVRACVRVGGDNDPVDEESPPHSSGSSWNWHVTRTIGDKRRDRAFRGAFKRHTGASAIIC